MQPSGDTATRKGIFDAITVGCIPVVFQTVALQARPRPHRTFPYAASEFEETRVGPAAPLMAVCVWVVQGQYAVHLPDPSAVSVLVPEVRGAYIG